MRSYTHIAGAILLFISFAYLTSLDYILYGMLFACLISLFPDILDNLSGKHRGWGHSILWLIPFTLTGFWSVTLAAALIIGLISHMVLDVLTTKGCPILYPLSKTNFVVLKENKRIKTGTNGEKAIFILLVFLLASIMFFTFFIINIEKTPINFNTFFASGTNETNITNHNTSNSHQNYSTTPQKDVNINLQVKNKENKNISVMKVSDNETDYLITDIKPGG
jgi:inner membrane protein